MQLIKAIIVAATLGSVSAPTGWAGDWSKVNEAIERGDKEASKNEIRQLAEEGDELAQAMIGGMGVFHEDVAEGARWYRKSAEQGEGFGMLFLGGAYATGEGVPQDFVSAYMWVTLALAAQGGSFRPLARPSARPETEIARRMLLSGKLPPSVVAGTENLQSLIVGKLTASEIAEARQLASECKNRNYKNC